MAMNGTTLGDDIADLLYASDASDEAKAQVKALWEAIAGKIVDHIKTNAQITVATGIPVSTTGSPAAQTGATTATGTATIA
jgi:hypothetical protein